MNYSNFWNYPLLDYSDITTRHGKCIVSSRSECDTSTEFGRYNFSVPIGASNMESIVDTTTVDIFNKNNVFYIYPRIRGTEATKAFVEGEVAKDARIISISIGISESDMDLLKWMRNVGFDADYITIDLAFAFTDAIKPFVDFIQKELPNTFLIVGNLYTGEGIEFLESLGVHCAKVNMGVSSVCRTKHATSFYSPTVTTLLECSAAAKHIKILSDGGLGITPEGDICAGDIFKAMYLGADMVLSGRTFAGCKDVPARAISYHGNASAQAKGEFKHIEGVSMTVPNSGKSITETVQWVKESLQSAISIAGKKDLRDLGDVQWGTRYGRWR